jgi:hypothetical protein
MGTLNEDVVWEIKGGQQARFRTPSEVDAVQVRAERRWPGTHYHEFPIFVYSTGAMNRP